MNSVRSARELLKRPLLYTINTTLGVVNLKAVPRHSWNDPQTYIPYRQTIEEARAAGMSVGDYIDKRHNVPGATQETIAQMQALGVFDTRIDRVCEIGPGSGRYLEKVMALCHPSRYEFYETAEEWASRLVREFGAIWQPTDSNTLSATTHGSIDLVHAHKVFSVTPFLTTLRYFNEMVRVTRIGGKVVFDIFDEACMDDATMQRWMNVGPRSGTFPAVLPRTLVLDFMTQRNLQLDGTFTITYTPGITTYYVFTRLA